MQGSTIEMERPARRRGNGPGRNKKRQFFAICAVIMAVAVVITAAAIIKGRKDGNGNMPASEKVQILAEAEVPSYVDVQILPEDCDSRRCEKLEDFNSVVIHYVGNPGTTAQNNRDYYDNEGTEVNSHFVVGLDGEVIQCLPLDEKSSATSERNRDTISIEVCHPDETGEFTQAAYESVVKLTAWLCSLCDFDETNIIRHYDATGKLCPLYYVEHEDKWLELKKDVMALIN